MSVVAKRLLAGLASDVTRPPSKKQRTEPSGGASDVLDTLFNCSTLGSTIDACLKLEVPLKDSSPLAYSTELDLIFTRTLRFLRRPNQAVPVASAITDALLQLLRDVPAAMTVELDVEPHIALLLQLIRQNDTEAELQTGYLRLLIALEPYIPNESTSLLDKMFEVAEPARLHRHPEWTVRVASLEMYGVLAVRKHESTTTTDSATPISPVVPRTSSTDARESNLTVATVATLLSAACLDSDSRVRCTAVCSLRHMQESDVPVPFSLYASACKTASDSCNRVRLYSLPLIAWFAFDSPDRVLTSTTTKAGGQTRCIDDVFSRLCNAMHDPSVAVRERAATLLGQLKAVGTKFLDQSLDKKIMSAMRVEKLSKRRRFGAPQSEWSTGRRFGADMPVEQAEDDELSIIPSGACGAFVTGLEDEFMAVRLASVKAVSALATSALDGDASSPFAKQVLDFLADMFNDEIQKVRLTAITCVRPLVAISRLKDEQAQILLNNLDDADVDARDALRELLCDCRLATREALQATIDALLNNLHRYPADKLGIWRCMQQLGLHHSDLALSLARPLLNLHDYFDTPEPDVQDTHYCAKLILLLNAASRCSPIQALFSDHTWRHYRYLRDSIPHLVTELPSQVTTHPLKDNSNMGDSAGAVQFTRYFDVITRTAHFLQHAPLQQRLASYDFLLDDLGLLVVDSSCSESLHFVHDFVSALRSFEQHVQRLVNGVEFSSRHAADLALYVSKTYELQTFYVHVPQAVLAHVSYLSVGLLALLIFCRPDSRETVESFEQRLAQLCSGYSGNLPVVDIRDAWNQAKADGEPLAACATQVLHTFVERHVPIWETIDHILVNNNRSRDVKMECEESGANVELKLVVEKQREIIEHITRRRVEIVEPSGSSANRMVKFNAALATTVTLTANLYNFCSKEILEENETDLLDAECGNLCVRVRYPDDTVQLYHPRASDFRRLSQQKIRLRTEVLLASTVWPEAAIVEISVVLCLPSVQLSCCNPVQITVFPKSKC